GIAKLDRAVEILRDGPVAHIAKNAVLDRRGDPEQALSSVEREGGERTYELEIGPDDPPAANRAVEPLDGATRHLARGQVAARGDGRKTVGARGKIERRRAAVDRKRDLETRASAHVRCREHELVAHDTNRVGAFAPDDEAAELFDVQSGAEQGRPVELRRSRRELEAAARRVRPDLAGQTVEARPVAGRLEPEPIETRRNVV